MRDICLIEDDQALCMSQRLKLHQKHLILGNADFQNFSYIATDFCLAIASAIAKISEVHPVHLIKVLLQQAIQRQIGRVPIL